MEKEIIISKIKEIGLVAIVRAQNGDDAMRYCEECAEAGAAVLEVTFTVPGAHRVLERLSGKLGGAVLGAGTVLDAETARVAILSGAEFLVSPNINPDAIRLSNRYRVPIIPGAQTVSEIIAAMELGCDIIKLFPAESPKVIKAIKGPLPQANIMPTGGVTLDNVGDWITSGAVAVGVGGALVGSGGIAVTTRAFVERIQEARAGMCK